MPILTTPFYSIPKNVTKLHGFVQLCQTFRQRFARFEAHIVYSRQFQRWDVFHGKYVVIVDIGKVKELLCETSEESRSKKTGESCLREVHSSIVVCVQTIKDSSQKTHNFDVIKLLDGNFSILVCIQVGNQNRVNLVVNGWLPTLPMQEDGVDILLKEIPRSSSHQRADNLERKLRRKNENRAPWSCKGHSRRPGEAEYVDEHRERLLPFLAVRRARVPNFRSNIFLLML